MPEQKLNGIQSMILNMLGGPEGIARLFKSLLQGMEPMEVVNGIKGSFDAISARLAAVDRRQIELDRFIRAALDPRNQSANSPGRELAGLGSTLAAGDRTVAAIGDRPADADPGGARNRSRGNGVADRGT